MEIVRNIWLLVKESVSLKGKGELSLLGTLVVNIDVLEPLPEGGGVSIREEKALMIPESLLWSEAWTSEMDGSERERAQSSMKASLSRGSGCRQWKFGVLER
jgi:hypothetical protein